jgi:acid stress chaperone HdeB
MSIKVARRNEMSKMARLISGFILALGAISSVQAQVTVDVAKITCDQLTGFDVKDPRDTAIWLSGYYHGKHSNPVLDIQEFRKDARKLWDYCIRNPKISVMNAIETLLKPDSK